MSAHTMKWCRVGGESKAISTSAAVLYTQQLKSWMPHPFSTYSKDHIPSEPRAWFGMN